ncbi:MAG TPA: hypothetical protein VGF45_13530 [Polyangia bacterium]
MPTQPMILTADEELSFAKATLEEIVRGHIRWMQSGGDGDPPGTEGYNHSLGTIVQANPFSQPEWVRTGLVRWQQLSSGGWYGVVIRGNTSARVCVKNAIHEVRANRTDRTIGWLCAGQAHNGNARAELRQDPALTLRILGEFNGIVG